jgi:hypothetical protein
MPPPRRQAQIVEPARFALDVGAVALFGRLDPMRAVWAVAKGWPTWVR